VNDTLIQSLYERIPWRMRPLFLPPPPEFHPLLAKASAETENDFAYVTLDEEGSFPNYRLALFPK
jgi:hypothetical protein